MLRRTVRQRLPLGKLADLIAVDGDPLQDVVVLQQVSS